MDGEVIRTDVGASADELALLIESVTDYAIFLLDTDGRIRTWNRGAERIKGYSAEEIVGEHFSRFYTPEDQERGHPDHELKVALRDGRYEEEGWRVRKDGTRFWASVVITPVRGRNGELIGFGKVTRDLTARRVNEEQLRARAAELERASGQLDQFRRLVVSVRDYAIFMLDPSGHIASWNAGARYLNGYEAEEVIGRHFELFCTPEDRARAHPAHELAVASEEGRYEEEGWRVRKDGTQFWARVSIAAVRGNDGELLGYAKVTRDLTARREAEEALREANEDLRRSNEELDRFASIAAHDLSDPLRTVSGFAELLAHQDLPGDAAEYVGHITATAERMSRLLADLLEYARAGEAAVSAEPVSLRDAAGSVMATLAAAVGARGADVVEDLPEEAAVLASRGDVELVLQNLIANALKFGDAAAPRVEVAAAAVDGGWRLTVTDNGPGIAAADQERIFAPFERAHPELSRGGTGLGLAICERLVRRHGGQLGVQSEPGQGATFWVLLPAAVATA
jgi:PAS domain S-box-containing protein